MACLGMAPPRTLLPLLLLGSSVASTGQYVGPGPGAWEVGVPEQHGLDSKQLAAAAASTSLAGDEEDEDGGYDTFCSRGNGTANGRRTSSEMKPRRSSSDGMRAVPRRTSSDGLGSLSRSDGLGSLSRSDGLAELSGGSRKSCEGSPSRANRHSRDLNDFGTMQAIIDRRESTQNRHSEERCGSCRMSAPSSRVTSRCGSTAGLGTTPGMNAIQMAAALHEEKLKMRKHQRSAGCGGAHRSAGRHLVRRCVDCGPSGGWRLPRHA